MSELIKSWDPIWEKVFLETPWGKYPGESLIQFIARNFYNSNRSEVKILEVGCGPGANIWYMAKENFVPYGIDGSETAIIQAKRRLAEEGLNGNLMVGDIVSLTYQNDFFDAVLDCECLYANNLENTYKILSEIDRVLKPGGLFYSRTLSDKIYIGKNYTKVDEKSYTDISDGPISGKGFARLMDLDDIKKVYGSRFDIISIDKLEYTKGYMEQTISEYIIICKKK
jgi:2-polyprenyl-3-methyl-5-hydroxy-6-metoxy-1,4-benzoquinol methylase